MISTLPLSRYYAANKDKLPHPFKVIQTDRVFRAERPQKGRLREFVQCDIDILGDEQPQRRGRAHRRDHPRPAGHRLRPASR